MKKKKDNIKVADRMLNRILCSEKLNLCSRTGEAIIAAQVQLHHASEDMRKLAENNAALLEALEAALYPVEHYETHEWDGGVLAMVKTAIKKAKGE